MAIKDRKYWQDLGSDEVNLIREQLNRLTSLLQAIYDEAVTADGGGTPGDTFVAAVAALSDPAFENLVPDRLLPKPRRQDPK